MHRRFIRIALLVTLLAAGTGAAWFFWNAQQQSAATLAAAQQIDNRLDAMLASLVELAAAQQAYGAPGQPAEPSFDRVSLLLQQLRGDAVSLRALTRSADAGTRITRFDADLTALGDADARRREYLRAGEELMAADLQFSEGRQALAAMNGGLRAISGAERAFERDQARAAGVQAAQVLGGSALVWVLGLLLLVPSPRPADGARANVLSIVDRTPSAPVAPAPVTSVDLTKAAEVCAGFAALANATELTALLARAADVLDASGVILWLEAEGQLFAVASHGYDPAMLARVGPLTRSAGNATAAAWRHARLQTVHGGEGHGAIVAPLVGHGGCRGALAIEVRHASEHDPASQAVASMFASQLAGVVAAWPGAAAEPSSMARAGL